MKARPVRDPRRRAREGREPPRSGGRARGLAVALALAVLPFPALAAELRISIDGIRSQHGTVLIGVYDSATSFENALRTSGSGAFVTDPYRVAAAALRVDAAMRSAVVFTDLAPGRYAVIAFQDENDNGKLDKSFLGVPTEPYGFSNNAKGFLSSPSFDAAAITLGPADKAIRIALVH